MAKNKGKQNKQKQLQEKKQLQNEKNVNAKEQAAKEKEEKEQAAKQKAEKAAEEKEAKMEQVKKYKYIIATLVAFCFAFVAGIAYNAYCSNGHLFDDEIEYFYDNESKWHAFNGRYVRIPVDAVIGWYSGTTTDETTGELVMTGKQASCMMWLDSDSFMSLTVNSQKEFDDINNIIEETQNYLNDAEDGQVDESEELSKIYVEGQIRRPKDADLKKYNEYFLNLVEGWGFTEADYYHYELTLDTSANWKSVKVTTIVYIVFAIVFLIATIIVSSKYHKYKKINGIKIVRE